MVFGTKYKYIYNTYLYSIAEKSVKCFLQVTQWLYNLQILQSSV